MRWACACLVLLAGCGGARGPRHDARPAPVPVAPISAAELTGGGRIVIVNGWQGRFSGQRLTVAAGRYAAGGGVVAVSSSGHVEREVRAPRGEGALRYVRRDGARLLLRSRARHAFALDLRTLALTRRGARAACPGGALRGPRPRLRLRDTPEGLRPLPPPRSDAFAALQAIVAAVDGNIAAIDAKPARSAPCGLASRSLAAHVSIATPRPIVSVVRRTVLVARFGHGWRAWRVIG